MASPAPILGHFFAEASMVVPAPRTPRCLRHAVWLASCPSCAEQRTAEREAARQRLQQAAR